jgi:DNA-binding NarL/FixJ family response regulator
MSVAADEGDRRAIRVVIVDDHALFRRGLELVLSEDPEIEIVGEAEDGIQAIELADELEPDVMLMDVRMPRASGIEAARAVRAGHPDVKVIMLTVSDDENDLYESIKAGANGYLLKEVAIEEVPDAIRSVAQGHSLISPSMASTLLAQFNVLARRAEEPQAAPAPRLTERELEVLRLVARGLSNREIGAELYIAENTVKNHVRNILEKLHLHSRMEAVVYAMREKLLEVE